eukprot:COSAG01_NODE_1206_length_11242_cov_29.405905_3_plen_92_part_00
MRTNGNEVHAGVKVVCTHQKTEGPQPAGGKQNRRTPLAGLTGGGGSPTRGRPTHTQPAMLPAINPTHTPQQGGAMGGNSASKVAAPVCAQQ